MKISGYLFVAEPEDTIALDNDVRIQDAADNGFGISWNRDGRQGLIPNEILVHALGLLADWKKAEDLLGCTIPADVRVLRWAQATLPQS